MPIVAHQGRTPVLDPYGWTDFDGYRNQENAGTNDRADVLDDTDGAVEVDMFKRFQRDDDVGLDRFVKALVACVADDETAVFVVAVAIARGLDEDRIVVDTDVFNVEFFQNMSDRGSGAAADIQYSDLPIADVLLHCFEDLEQLSIAACMQKARQPVEVLHFFVSRRERTHPIRLHEP
ncbi:hypothetical protein D3C80_1270270 [compost metagenome]